MKLLVSTITALITLLTADCFAGPTVEQLRQGCRTAMNGIASSAHEEWMAAQCVGYVSGFLDGIAIYKGMSDRMPVCIPGGGMSNEQGIALFLKHAEAHPEFWQDDARGALYASLANAFPCAKQK